MAKLSRRPADDRVRSLLAQGRRLLAGGRSRQAADVFERILLRDVHHQEARQGFDEARAALEEERRLLELRFEEARAALQSGAPEQARAMLEAVIEGGGDRDRARALLERLDAREGRLQTIPACEALAAITTNDPPRSGTGAWRRALVAAWAVTFVLVGAAVALRWERLLGTLARAPSPAVQPAPALTYVPSAREGDRALAEARRLLEAGDAAAALRALEGVSPEEPAYPFAQRLREQALAAPAGQAR